MSSVFHHILIVITVILKTIHIIIIIIIIVIMIIIDSNIPNQYSSIPTACSYKISIESQWPNPSLMSSHSLENNILININNSNHPLTISIAQQIRTSFTPANRTNTIIFL